MSEEMGEVCRQKLVGCRAGRVGEMEPDASPAEETVAKPGGRCAPGFSKPNKQAQLRRTHSSTSSGPLVEDRSLVARHQVSLCYAACQWSGLGCAGSFMAQADVTQQRLSMSIRRLGLTWSKAQNRRLTSAR